MRGLGKVRWAVRPRQLTTTFGVPGPPARTRPGRGSPPVRPLPGAEPHAFSGRLTVKGCRRATLRRYEKSKSRGAAIPPPSTPLSPPIPMVVGGHSFPTAWAARHPLTEMPVFSWFPSLNYVLCFIPLGPRPSLHRPCCVRPPVAGAGQRYVLQEPAELRTGSR